LPGEESLAGWLHRTALLEVKRWWRTEFRRRRREQTAVELGTVMKSEDSLLKALGDELDEGLLELREADRQALLLRYFEGHTHSEIGTLLGAREDAVRMRIDKALDRLTRFFRRRGYAVPTVATTVTALASAVKAAPAGLAIAATRSALLAGSASLLTGLQPLLARFMGLTKTQTTVLCVAIAVTPVVWEWNASRISRHRATDAQSKLDAVRAQEDQSSAELARLRAESARLDAALAEAQKNQAPYETAARKLEDLKARVRGLLTDANYHWPDDLPYVRVSKQTVKNLNQLVAWPGTFSPSGRITEQAQELFAITGQEKAPAEQALADYWHGVEDLMTASAYETNTPGTEPGRLSKTVVVPALGDRLKVLAEQTRMQLTPLSAANASNSCSADGTRAESKFSGPGTYGRSLKPRKHSTYGLTPAPTASRPGTALAGIRAGRE
jgi:hypothetical protein